MPDRNELHDAELLALFEHRAVRGPDPSAFLYAVAKRRWERRVRAASAGVLFLAMLLAAGVLLRPPSGAVDDAGGVVRATIARGTVQAGVDRPTVALLAMRQRSGDDRELWLGPEPSAGNTPVLRAGSSLSTQ
jgi:hypothetical protein